MLYYTVLNTQDQSVARIVSAANPQQVRAHMAREKFSVGKASQKDLVSLIGSGVSPEFVNGNDAGERVYFVVAAKPFDLESGFRLFAAKNANQVYASLAEELFTVRRATQSDLISNVGKVEISEAKAAPTK